MQKSNPLQTVTGNVLPRHAVLGFDQNITVTCPRLSVDRMINTKRANNGQYRDHLVGQLTRH